MSEQRGVLPEHLKQPVVLDEELRRRLLEALLAPPQPPHMTYEEFLSWADEDTLAEWVGRWSCTARLQIDTRTWYGS